MNCISLQLAWQLCPGPFTIYFIGATNEIYLLQVLCSLFWLHSWQFGNTYLGSAHCGPVQYCVHELKDEPTYFDAQLKKKISLSLQYLKCWQHANLCWTECIIEELKGKWMCCKNVTLFYWKSWQHLHRITETKGSRNVKSVLHCNKQTNNRK